MRKVQKLLKSKSAKFSFAVPFSTWESLVTDKQEKPAEQAGREKDRKQTGGSRAMCLAKLFLASLFNAS